MLRMLSMLNRFCRPRNTTMRSISHKLPLTLRILISMRLLQPMRRSSLKLPFQQSSPVFNITFSHLNNTHHNRINPHITQRVALLRLRFNNLLSTRLAKPSNIRTPCQSHQSDRLSIISRMLHTCIMLATNNLNSTNT